MTDRLVRIEYNPNGNFVDNASERVIFRKFLKVNFSVDSTGTLLQIKTSMFTLNYVKDKPITKSKMPTSSNLQVILNNTDRVWQYGNAEVRNFGGIPYSLDDFKTVIDKKCVDWMNTDMQKYLRPETLFGTKFESYLNQPIRNKRFENPFMEVLRDIKNE